MRAGPRQTPRWAASGQKEKERGKEAQRATPPQQQLNQDSSREIQKQPTTGANHGSSNKDSGHQHTHTNTNKQANQQTPMTTMTVTRKQRRTVSTRKDTSTMDASV